MKAAWQALGGDPDQLELLIMQLVNLLEDGKARGVLEARRASS